MIYFQDFASADSLLSDAELGQLFRGILRYAQHGELPDFAESIPLQLIWGFVQPKIDRDAETYNTHVQKSRYGVYLREVKRQGETPLTFDDWLSEGDMMSPSQPVTGAHPKAKATATEEATTNATVEGEGTGRGEPGETGPLSPTAFERKRRENVASLLGYK